MKMKKSGCPTQYFGKTKPPLEIQDPGGKKLVGFSKHKTLVDIHCNRAVKRFQKFAPCDDAPYP